MTTTAATSTSTTAQSGPVQLTLTQSLALGFTLTGLRPEWDTPADRARLDRVTGKGFAHADDFAHVIRAAVAYATAKTPEERATETRPAGSRAFNTLAFFDGAGPWWTATR